MIETRVDATTVQWLVSGFTLVNAIVIAISAFRVFDSCKPNVLNQGVGNARKYRRPDFFIVKF
jgi:hypothetical protein